MLASYLLGLILLSALLGVVFQFSEIEAFVALAERVQPLWLAGGLLLQVGTYLAEALAWRATLAAVGRPVRLSTLVPLSLAKLFSDQAVPSVGLSGNTFFLGALDRRGIESRQAVSCMLVDIVTYFSAYLLIALLNLLVLEWRHAANRWIVTLTAVFVALQSAVPLLVFRLRRGGALVDRIMARYLPQRFGTMARLLREAPAALPSRPGFIAKQILLHALVALFDAGSLWMMLKGIGQEVSPVAAFSSFVTASMVASLSFIPLGLGTFEATCVAMLHVFGIGLEAGLTATILLRGLTAWLPMLPGMWLIRREMRRSRGPALHGT